MGIVAVDLAAKYSAGMYLSLDGRVEEQFDSAGRSEHEFLDRCVTAYSHGFADQLVVEDLPHGVGYRTLVKRVCQLQGRLAEKMHTAGKLHELLFVNPETWRRKYPVLRKRGLGMDAVVPVAAELGYTPPDLSRLNGPRGGAALAQKVATDYCAAFLLGQWALDALLVDGTFNHIPGTARYGQSTIRKQEA